MLIQGGPFNQIIHLNGRLVLISKSLYKLESRNTEFFFTYLHHMLHVYQN